MRTRGQAFDIERRKPRQARAHDTVEAIFEATAQILQREGPGRLSTNRIAERAGISIGSLYQYFPNKDAILVAMGERQLAMAQAAVTAALAKAPSLLPEQRARLVICSLIDTFGSRRKLGRHLLETFLALGLHAELNRPLEEIARALAQQAHRLAPRLEGFAAPERLFVLTRAVAGVIRAAVLEESPLLGSAILEDELVALVIGYAARLLAAPSSLH
jgi:AcrR family transcriptional regulator